MIEATVTAKSTRRPRKSVREKAYAAIAEMATVMAVTHTAITTLFTAHTGRLPWPKMVR
ncbi:hypothetical protein GCM10009578_068810 [Streptomyces rhizosphaericus]